MSDSENLEKHRLKLGMIPLTDCAVLVVAKEKGYFKKYGLEVTISKEASWANIRDKVSVGELDGAQMLAGMPVASSLGVGIWQKPMITAFSMDLNGNAITLSEKLCQKMLEVDPEAMQTPMQTAIALKQVIHQHNAANRSPMTFGVVFSVSMHNYQLRYWLAAIGIDPDKDVRIVVVPPAQMPLHLESGHISGYCVGEPWNSFAVQRGIGRTVVTGYEIWNNSPEKVFGVTEAWAARYPNTHQALIMALLEAAQYLDSFENRLEVVDLITQQPYLNMPANIVKMSMLGTFQYAAQTAPRQLPDFNVFYKYSATFPWRSHAAWLITQMIRWGQLIAPVDIKAAATKSYRADIYREAAQKLGLACPTGDYKTEGEHDEPWLMEGDMLMGQDCFFDGMHYDPANLTDYIAQLPFSHMSVPTDALAVMNG
ncbi:MAG: CmpA/NrtA family ABC transporter substrate-binding protein [Pseudomonadota bacterium]